jgi:Mrp family chromosome partitioning ATPase
VVRGGTTSRQVVRRSRQTLQEIGAKIIGVVLNRAEIQSHDYYYYPYHYKSYGMPPNGEQASESNSLSVMGK